MRIDSIVMMIVIGLVLGEKVNRVSGNGAYWSGFSGRNDRNGIPSGSGAGRNAGEREHGWDYLEKLVTEYEIIPLMSKLI